MKSKSLFIICCAIFVSFFAQAQQEIRPDSLMRIEKGRNAKPDIKQKVKKEVTISVDADGKETRTEKVIVEDADSDGRDIVKEDKDVKIKKNEPMISKLRNTKKTKLYWQMASGVSVLDRKPTSVNGLCPEQDIWRSWFFDFGFLFKTRLNNSSTAPFTLNYGLTFLFNHFDLKGDATLSTDRNLPALFSPSDIAGANVTDNDLYVNYLTVPVGFEYKPGKGIPSIGVSAYGGIRLNSYSKLNYTKINDGADVEIKSYHRFGLSNFNYGVRANLAFSNLINLYFRYDLSSMFVKNSINDYRIAAVGFNWVF